MKGSSITQRDLQALAAGERQALGEPPTPEQLIALRDGTLPETEAERLRDRLAVDPQWAALYADLQSFADLEPAPGVDVDRAWHDLQARLDGEPAVADGGADIATAIPPVHRRQRWPAMLALAAILLLAVGITWLVDQSPEPRVLVETIVIDGTVPRDNRLPLSRDVDFLDFRIELPANGARRPVVDISDAYGATIPHETLEPDNAPPVFRLTVDLLQEDRNYELLVRSADDSQILARYIFSPIFTD